MSKVASFLIVLPFLPLVALSWVVGTTVTALAGFLEKRFDHLGWFQ